MDGFDRLLFKLESCHNDLTDIKVGLEAAGHYSDNILSFLVSKGLTTIVINPLHTNLSNAENRKDIVKAVSEITGHPSKYLGVPSCRSILN